MSEIKFSLSHIAFAVNDIDESTGHLKELFDTFDLTNKVEYKNFSMFSKKVAIANTEFEYMEPLGDGMIKQFLDKNKEGFHHLAFKCSDLHSFINKLEEKNIRIIKEEGCDVDYCFIHPKETGGLLIEVHKEV